MTVKNLTVLIQLTASGGFRMNRQTKWLHSMTGCFRRTTYLAILSALNTMVFLIQTVILICAKNHCHKNVIPGQKMYQNCFNGRGSAPEPAGELIVHPNQQLDLRGEKWGSEWNEGKVKEKRGSEEGISGITERKKMDRKKKREKAGSRPYLCNIVPPQHLNPGTEGHLESVPVFGRGFMVTLYWQHTPASSFTAPTW